jgi:hypothetical protein
MRPERNQARIEQHKDGPMKSFGLLSGVLMAGALLGCSATSLVGSGGGGASTYYGRMSVVGHNNVYRVASGSRVEVLAVSGDGNQIDFEDDTTCVQIEFWGNGNTVTVPEHLHIAVRSVGQNRVIKRPLAGDSLLPREPGGMVYEYDNGGASAQPTTSGDRSDSGTSSATPSGGQPRNTNQPPRRTQRPPTQPAEPQPMDQPVDDSSPSDESELVP